MIYLITAIVALSVFVFWVFVHTGLPASISSTFYHPKTQKTYTLVISGIGVLMMLYLPDTLIQWAGVCLIFGTAAPDFKHTTSLSKLIHFGFTGATALLAWTYIGGIWMGITGVILLGLAKLSQKRLLIKPVFWVEVVLFYVTFITLLIYELV